MPEVPRTRTPIAMAAAGRLLVAAFGGQLHRHQAALLLAQVAFETDEGRACDNHNLGNITGEYDGSFFRPQWFTVTEASSPKLRALHAAMLKGEAPNRFRAYPEALLGALDYAGLLKQRFPSIVASALANDPEGMAVAIKRSGYTPDAPAGLGATLRRLRDKFLAFFADLPPGPAEPVSSGLALLALLLAWSLFHG